MRKQKPLNIPPSRCRWTRSLGAAALVFTLIAVGLSNVGAQEKKPNILIIWGDDIGWYNISAYNQGVMGYKTPSIDRLAREGAMFTDWYGQQSCTAGRAAFITGQSPVRTGLLKVGLPGAKEGLMQDDPTIAGLLKPQGYMTAQYGKNHLGDRDEHMPTVHGFDEFFGNLYHLNAEEEPENPDYPKDPEFRKRFGPRGVIKSTADGKLQDTGPLTKKRMETVDDEVTAGALDFIERTHKAGRPFFLWWNSTRMHIWTHLKRESQGKTGLGIYPDGMVEHDAHIGQILKKVDDLGIADNTIVMYSTDNGAEAMSWPDGGTTPFRGEKNTNWEGGYRVPCLIRWPGVLEPGTTYNDVFSHEDMLPTLLAAAGEPDIKEKLLKGQSTGGKNYKVHLDGYNLLPYFKGEAKEAPRKEFLYWTDGGQLSGLRFNQWKLVFLEQRPQLRGMAGTLRRASAPQDLQPAQRSVRAGRSRGYRLFTLARRPFVPAGAGPGICGAVAAELQGLPAAPKAGQFQHRSGDGEAN
jgi:arylsulfatase